MAAKQRCTTCMGKGKITKDYAHGKQVQPCSSCKGSGWVGVSRRRTATEGHLADNLPLVTK